MSDADLLTPAQSPLRRLTGVQIIGTGSYVPDQVVTNEALARLGAMPIGSSNAPASANAATPRRKSLRATWHWPPPSVA